MNFLSNESDIPIVRVMPRTMRRKKSFWYRLLKIILLLLTIISIFCLVVNGQRDEPQRQSLADLNKSHITIVLDAGHGGTDGGSISGKTYEKDLNLQFVKTVGELLSKSGYHVLYTRETDKAVSLEERVQFANKKKAAMFISIHCNAAEIHEANGLEIYYSEKDNSDNLAMNIHAAMIDSVKMNDRGVNFGNYKVLTETDMMGVLVEVGFLSNKEEKEHLLDANYRDKVAKAIVNGIDAFIAGDN